MQEANETQKETFLREIETINNNVTEDRAGFIKTNRGEGF